MEQNKFFFFDGRDAFLRRADTTTTNRTSPTMKVTDSRLLIAKPRLFPLLTLMLVGLLLIGNWYFNFIPIYFFQKPDNPSTYYSSDIQLLVGICLVIATNIYLVFNQRRYVLRLKNLDKAIQW